jgi:pimeloyl-ACP methyl ester carboxylesterase
VRSHWLLGLRAAKPFRNRRTCLRAPKPSANGCNGISGTGRGTNRRAGPWHPRITILGCASRVVIAAVRVIAVSLRHYPERWNGKGGDYREAHNDLAVFIEQLGAGPVYLVGHSRGGRVAFDAARTRPELIRKLVLMEATLYSSCRRRADNDGRFKHGGQEKACVVALEQGDIEGGLEFYLTTPTVPAPGNAARKRNGRLAATMPGLLSPMTLKGPLRAPRLAACRCLSCWLAGRKAHGGS